MYKTCRADPGDISHDTLHGTVATARYTSPDPMQPSKGVLAAAAVRELKVFIENSVLMNESPFKVCRCQCDVHGRVGVDFCADGGNWVRAVRGSRAGECIFGLGETHTAMATAKQGATLVRHVDSTPESFLVHPAHQYHPLPLGDHGDHGEFGVGDDGHTDEACLVRNARGIR